MKQRTLLTLPLTMLVVVAVAAPALAGSDSDDEDGGPVPTSTPAPIVQAPAPAPVIAAPAPAPPPVETTTPERVNRVVQGRERSAPTRRTHRTTKAKPKRSVQRSRVASARTVALRTAPRGGVQAGAGGTAAGLPLTIPASGLTF